MATEALHSHLKIARIRKEAIVNSREELGSLARKCSKSMYMPGSAFFAALQAETRSIFEAELHYGQFKKEMDLLLARLITRDLTHDQFHEAYAQLAEQIDSHSNIRSVERDRLNSEMVGLLDISQTTEIEQKGWVSKEQGRPSGPRRAK